MNTINKHTLDLLAKFLEWTLDDFECFLDKEDIEPSEAGVIIGDLRKFFEPSDAGPVIDRKFMIKAINPINGKSYDSCNSILLCAKDLAVPATLHAYQEECMRLGSNQEHVESMGYLIDRVLDFQREIGGKVPDTIGAEIPRCLFGDGI